MAEMFDPAVFLVLPGTNGGSATTRSTLLPCSCGCVQFEVAVEAKVDRESGARSERTSLRCVECFRFKKGDRNPPATILGWVDMNTGNVTEARCKTTTAS